ncbi:hypothetical protein [Bradyrhizobium sp. Cp5.3]|uniref:hypothetical protein n=1 Tax=Bradyrhizobium sp. Cp5.3 TaxID=443598 RepID=UPI0003F6BE40|nr:hypothetical protein [Bradyrhizobium sp. Cp5.3]
MRKKESSPRSTRAFETETEAKAFARARLEEGLVVFAGTLNPHLPRKLIHSQGIADWVADARDHDERTADACPDDK